MDIKEGSAANKAKKVTGASTEGLLKRCRRLSVREEKGNNTAVSGLKAHQYLTSNGSSSIELRRSTLFERRRLDEKKLVYSSSSDEKSSASTSSDDGSDFSDLDDSFDEKEYIRRKQVYSQQMGELEKRIICLEDCIYKQKLYLLEQELIKVKKGESEGYLNKVRKLQEAKKARQERADALLKLQKESIDHKYEAEKLAAKQDFENQVSTLYDEIKERIETEIKKLQESKLEIDIEDELWLMKNGLTRIPGCKTFQRIKKDRASRIRILNCKKFQTVLKDRASKLMPPPRRKITTVSGPHLVCQLLDSKIEEDVAQIRRAVVKGRLKGKRNPKLLTKCLMRTDCSYVTALDDCVPKEAEEF